MSEFDRAQFIAKEQLSPSSSNNDKGESQSIVGQIRKKLFSQKEIKSCSFGDIEEILKQQGCSGREDYLALRDVINKLFDLLGGEMDWKKFLSKEVVWEEENGRSTIYHHVEVRFIRGMLDELSMIMTRENLVKFVHSINNEDIVAFAKNLRDKGKPIIVEEMEKRESMKYTVDAGAQFWRFSDIQSLTMDEYLKHCTDRAESSGRLLVHVTKNDLFNILLRHPRVTSSALVHLQEKKHLKDVSEKLDELIKNSLFKTHSLSLGVHFSYDDSVKYPEGQYAVVFAAEALYNNYAFAQHTQDDDVVISGLTNDFFNDPTHEIDVLKYGFLLVPESYKDKVEVGLKDVSEKERPRIFYYSGTLNDGVEQIRARIGKAENKTRLRRSPQFQRGLDLNFSQESGKNRAVDVKAFIGPLKAAKNAHDKGELFYPPISDFDRWMNSDNGQGIFFSV